MNKLKAAQKDEQFNIELQYMQFLKRMKLNPETMHPQQKIQLRQAFYGAVSQMLVLMSGPIPDLPEMVGIGVLESMQQQCTIYWNRQLLTGGE